MKYVIYGAGRNGKKLLEKLQKASFRVDLFCDGDKKIQEQGECCGIQVISPKKLLEMKEQAYVFVSPKKADEIYEFLEREKFPHVCPKEVADVLYKMSPQTNSEGKKWPMYEPGHYYSLYPDLEDLKKRIPQIYNNPKILDIDLNDNTQLRIYEELTKFYDDMPDWPAMNSGTPPIMRLRANIDTDI